MRCSDIALLRAAINDLDEDYDRYEYRRLESAVRGRTIQFMNAVGDDPCRASLANELQKGNASGVFAIVRPLLQKLEAATAITTSPTQIPLFRVASK